MIFNKRGTMQLSLGFLVMTIIAITVFVLSIIFLTDFFNQATDLKTKLDEQTRGQIESLLAGNARVAIPLETKETNIGDLVQFGIGIRNTLPEEYFKVEINTQGKFIPAADPQSSYDLLCSDGICSINGYGTDPRYVEGDPAVEYLMGNNGDIKIEMNNKGIMLFVTRTIGHAPRGHYIFNIEVCSAAAQPSSCGSGSSDLYDETIHKVHMIVD